MALTETQKAQEIKDAYDAKKADDAIQVAAVAARDATIAANNTLIAQLQAQIAAGNPISNDQIAALKIVDDLDTEVEADANAAAPNLPSGGVAQAPVQVASTATNAGS